MNERLDPRTEKIIFIAQILSVTLIWIFVIGITVWIVNLIRLSIELQDSPGVSVGISIVAIPVFITLASILTYVFIGIHRGRNRISNKSEEK